jgi:hypothetical protein
VSAITSLSSLAKTVVDHRLVATCRDAVRAVDAAATGAFSVDLKEDRRGVPHVTEINAGRLLMAMTAFETPPDIFHEDELFEGIAVR